MARASLLVVGLGALVFGACSSTTGSTWVRQPEPGAFANEELTTSAHDLEAFDQPRTSRFVSDADGGLTAPARPRLDRTVTLGEVFVVPSERAEVEQAPNGAPVTVTINNYAYSPNGYDDGYYGGYLLPLIADDGRPGRPRPAPRPMQPGQDWPTPPSYGPPFPYKTAPASPWH